LWQYLQYWKVPSPNKWMSDSLRNLRLVSVENITIFVSLLLMYIIFSSWLENASCWTSASHVSSLDFGNFGCVFLSLLYMACLTDLTSPGNRICVLLRNFCHNNLVRSFSQFIRGLALALLTNFMSLNRSLIWLRMVMLESAV
jgi:hypothetical protein